jgi:hypothetical protein
MAVLMPINRPLLSSSTPPLFPANMPQTFHQCPIPWEANTLGTDCHTPRVHAVCPVPCMITNPSSTPRRCFGATLAYIFTNSTHGTWQHAGSAVRSHTPLKSRESVPLPPPHTPLGMPRHTCVLHTGLPPHLTEGMK